MGGDEPKTQLLNRAEARWAILRDALYNPQEWASEAGKTWSAPSGSGFPRTGLGSLGYNRRWP
ncbi:hypothetical protein YIM1640_02240 [Thermus oshimai]